MVKTHEFLYIISQKILTPMVFTEIIHGGEKS